MTSQEADCGNCRYWKTSKYADTNDLGWCQRHAPKPRVLFTDEEDDKWSDMRLWTYWPLTSSSDCCGEHMEAI